MATNTCSQNYKFTGKERDSESGLDNFGARYNASGMGRFTRPDPSSVGGDFVQREGPQNWNMYSYVLNNPLAAVDPSGLDCIYTDNQSESSVNVTIVRGDCKSEDDNGVYVNGTIDENSLSYNGTDLSFSFSVNKEDYAATGVGVLELGQPEKTTSTYSDQLFQSLGQAGLMANQGVKLAAVATAPEWLVAGGAIAAVELAGSGVASLGLSTATEVTSTPGQVASVSRTAAQAGRKGVEKMLRTLTERLAEHEADLARYKAEGGFTSKTESEIANFKGLIQAAQEWLSKNP